MGKRGPLVIAPSVRLTSRAQELDNDANIVSVRFTKSVIASKEAFTYEAAQKRKDDRFAHLWSWLCAQLTCISSDP